MVDLDLPSLAERRQDIPDLVGYMVRKFNKKLGFNVQDVSPAAMQALSNYGWPGNIRELSNVIERAVLFCDEPTIDQNHLPKDITN